MLRRKNKFVLMDGKSPWCEYLIISGREVIRNIDHILDKIINECITID